MGIVAGSIAGFDVYWYGLLISVAIILGYVVTAVNLYGRKLGLAHLTEVFIISIIVGILVARIGYILLYMPSYSGQWREVWMFSHGGLSPIGAFVGVLLALFLYARRYDINFWLWLDLLTPAFLLVCIMAQIGNFMLQATVGMPILDSQAANMHIIQYIEYYFRPMGFESYGYFRPVALYQSLWQICVLAVVVYFSQASKCYRLRQGSLFLLAVILVCIGRVVCGMIYLGAGEGAQLSQIVCIIVAIIAMKKVSIIARQKQG